MLLEELNVNKYGRPIQREDIERGIEQTTERE